MIELFPMDMPQKMSKSGGYTYMAYWLGDENCSICGTSIKVEAKKGYLEGVAISGKRWRHKDCKSYPLDTLFKTR